MSAIGFDIGNDSCVIAAERRGGIDVLLNYGLERETPAVVSFGESRRFIGSAGAASACNNLKSTISQVKRLIGMRYKDPSVQNDLSLLPFETSEGSRGGVLIHLNYLNKRWTFMPLEILGMLFSHLKEIAEKNLESPIVDCVIGIPSYFTDLQRREYLDAALLAGLKPLKLIHDGTAIALAYGMHKTDFSDLGSTNVIFVDIGHCDTQVTVVAFNQGKMEILSHCFDQNLGGRDFDEVLFKYFARQFKEQYGVDVYSNAQACIRLTASCEKLKKVLSANDEAPLSIESFIEDKDVKGCITRKEFDILSLELLERITFPCIKAVKDSGLSVDKIYAIELAGSGSQLPAIVRKLTTIFWKEPSRTINASEYVARGCALQCALLTPTHKVKEYKVQDVFPYSIAFSVNECENKPRREITFFPKGTPFPRYYMHKNEHTPLHIQVLYNKAEFPGGISPPVGYFKIGPQSSGAERVRVVLRFQLNRHGIVEIESSPLLDSVEKRCDARPNSTKALLTLIVEYRAVTKSMPPKLKNEINSECQKAELWLRNRYQQQESVKNMDPIRWSSLMKQAMDKLECNCKIIMDSNVQYLENLNVATTKVELREAQEREKLLAEQDRKVEQTKDQINNLESDTPNKAYEVSKSVGVSENVLGDRRTNKGVHYYGEKYSKDFPGKPGNLRKSLDESENKNKDEKDGALGTEPLLTFIAKYRLLSVSLPPIQRDKLNNECIKAEQWLNDHSQHHSSPDNVDPIHWSIIIKYSSEAFKRRCEHIITPKSMQVD